MKKRNFGYVIFLGLVVLFSLFILANAFMNFEASHSSSDSLLEAILPNSQNSEFLKLAIRKVAHLVEYAFLGAAAMGLALYFKRKKGIAPYGFACFFVLAVAVMDEHIQSFSDRTSSTGDILLDFFGGLIGFFVVFLFLLIHKRIKSKKNQ